LTRQWSVLDPPSKELLPGEPPTADALTVALINDEDRSPLTRKVAVDTNSS